MTELCLYYVEDNEADRRLLALALDNQGVSVKLQVADDGERAYELLEDAAEGKRCRPDLVVLDLNIPKRSGLEVLARPLQVEQRSCRGTHQFGFEGGLLASTCARRGCVLEEADGAARIHGPGQADRGTHAGCQTRLNDYHHQRDRGYPRPDSG